MCVCSATEPFFRLQPFDRISSRATLRRSPYNEGRTARRAESYSLTKYGLVHALGLSGLICFAVAYIWLAPRVGWAVIYAASSPLSPFP